MNALDIERIYRDHGHVVRRRAKRILGSEDEANEVVQDLFTSLVQRPEQFGERCQTTTFLYSATTHACLNRIRRHKTRFALFERWQRTPKEADTTRIDESVALRQILTSLPEDLSKAYVYYHVDEMTHDEIARILGCSRRQVGNLLERAQERIAKKEQRR